MSHLSLDVSQKITMSDVKGYGNHVFRKSKSVMNHSNKEIDVNRTKDNIDYGSADNPFNSRFEDRLAYYNSTTKTGKQRKLRKDAVVLRGLVLQPSADVFEDCSNDSEKRELINRFVRDSIPFLVNEFGYENIIGISAHLDESNPHVHVAIMPMTEDGRLSQKDFFKGPKHLRALHKNYREHMNSRGWTFETENKNEDAKRFSEAEYKRNANVIEKARKEHTDKKRQLSQVVRDEVKQELMFDPDLREEAKAELRDELEIALKSSVRASVEREYKTIKDGLDAREAQITTSEVNFDDNLRLKREEFQKEQEEERKKLENERKALENEFVSRSNALNSAKNAIDANVSRFEDRFKRFESNLTRTFPGSLGVKLVNMFRGNDVVLTDLEQMNVNVATKVRPKDIENGLEF